MTHLNKWLLAVQAVAFAQFCLPRPAALAQSVTGSNAASVPKKYTGLRGLGAVFLCLIVCQVLHKLADLRQRVDMCIHFLSKRFP